MAITEAPEPPPYINDSTVEPLATRRHDEYYFEDGNLVIQVRINRISLCEITNSWLPGFGDSLQGMGRDITEALKSFPRRPCVAAR